MYVYICILLLYIYVQRTAQLQHALPSDSRAATSDSVSVALWAARVSVYGKDDEQIIVVVCLWLCARIQQTKVNLSNT